MRRFTRLPNLILWTPTLALGIVLANDVSTLQSVSYLHPYVGRFETVFALYMFAYIVYRTIKCFQQTREATEIWVNAWNKINEESNPELKILPHPTVWNRSKKWLKLYANRNWIKQWFKLYINRNEIKSVVAAIWQKIKAVDRRNVTQLSQKAQKQEKNSLWKERRRMLIGLGLVASAIAAHLFDEQQPGPWHTIASTLASSPKGIKDSLLKIWPAHFGFIGAMVAVSAIAAGVWRGKKENVSKARKCAWCLLPLAAMEILTHVVKAKKGDFLGDMQGFYSAPVLLLASAVLLYRLRERPEEVKEEDVKPQEAAKAANA